MLEVWPVCNYLDSKFYDEVSAILYLFGYLLRVWGCFPSSPILLSIKMPKYGKKYHIGRHYAIISADLLGIWFEDPAWYHDGDLIVSWNYCGAVMELVRNYHGSVMELAVCQLGCWIIMSKDLAEFMCWLKLWNNAS